MYFPGDWQVDNRKLCSALKSYAAANGIEIKEDTAVEALVIDNGKAIGAEANGVRYNADTVVLATGAWTSLIKLGPSAMPVDIQPVRGQMIAFDNPERIIRHVIYSRRGYLVPRLNGRILAGSTSESVGFDRSVTRSAAASIREMAGEIAPVTAGWEVGDHWAGLRPHAADGLPVLGSVDGVTGLIIASAHYRNGILLAPVTARLIAESLIDDIHSEYLDLYGIGRFRPRGIGAIS